MSASKELSKDLNNCPVGEYGGKKVSDLNNKDSNKRDNAKAASAAKELSKGTRPGITKRQGD